MQNNVIPNLHWPTDKQVDSHNNFSDLNLHMDDETSLLWMYMQPPERQCFTTNLLSELISCKEIFKNNSISYAVLASSHETKFNLGGDLALFEDCISRKDTNRLREYAYLCIDACYTNYSVSRTTNTTTISLIQGDALGGGFEAALSSDIIIAEKGVNFGLPEVMFNMFPGMGAYSFLSRKVGLSKTREMITSGKFYAAEELYEMGVIDILAEKGQGDLAVYNYITKEERAKNTFNALRKVAQMNNPVTHQELKDIVDIWVDSAMNLKTRDLKMMKRIVGKQNKK